jgi:hydroxymethylpyrimidine pyrophosphatase-like HAD family hydrolase
MIFAIDFDGTLTEESKYPEVGKERIFAIQTCKDLQKAGHQLVLWTCRSGETLKEAVEWCRKRGFEPDAVNENVGWAVAELHSPKIYADHYIDDRSFPAFNNWSSVRTKFLTSSKPIGIKED